MQVIAVAFGLGALVQESIAVFTVIKLVGAAYLVYLGVQTFRHRRSLADALHAPVEPKVLRRILADGVPRRRVQPEGHRLLHGRAAAVRRPLGAARSPLQLLTLGAIFCAIALLCDSIWALLAGAARSWLVALAAAAWQAIGGAGGRRDDRPRRRPRRQRPQELTRAAPGT